LRKTKVTAIVSAFLVLLMVFNSSAVAANSSPDAVDSITITNISGILKGETLQLQASVETSGFLFKSVEWSSNNPDVISCTKDGKIKGLVAGKSAKITCKAKYGSAKDSITVYCVERLPKEVKVKSKYMINLISQHPGLGLKDLWIDLAAIFGPFFEVFKILARTTLNVHTENKITACGRIKNYVYVRYGESNSQDGFLKYSSIKEDIEGFLSVTPTDMNVWANGVINETKKLTTDYAGDVKWTYDKNYVSFDEKTGQVIGLKPGTTTITANADGMTAKCTVHLLYKWPQEWVAKTNKKTALYKAIGDGFESRKDLPKGTEVTVYGDTGTSDGWAFACYTNGEDVWWGHIPIADVSNKNTISYYNSLNWTWPVRDKKNDATQTIKARYITSPYGWRDTDPAQHKGVDITNGVSSSLDFSNSVDGYEVVSAFAGKVIFVHDNSTGYKSCGNCVAIRSNEKDPITGKYYVAIYMHLKSNPKVIENQNVSANKLLGYVGNTGNSGGSHLHFEVNNQNLSYGQKAYYESNSNKEMVFGSVINPLFFYMNYYNLPESNSGKITINPTCDAMNYRKPLWYGDDIKESKKP